MSNSPPAFITVNQAARLLDVAEITIRRWLNAGQLSYIQPGGKRGRILIPFEALASPRPAHPQQQPQAREDDREAVRLRSQTTQQPSAPRRRSGPRAKWRRS